MPRFLSFYPLISLYVSFSAFPIWSDGPSDGMPESSIRTRENAERELEWARALIAARRDTYTSETMALLIITRGEAEIFLGYYGRQLATNTRMYN
jgi:hypothetical protein